MDARSPSVGPALEASAQAPSLVVAAKTAEEKSRMLRYLIAVLIASQSVAYADQVILFHRDGCSPCAKAKAALTADPSLLGGIDLALVDTRKHPQMAAQYGVKAVPVLVLEQDGKEVARKVGWQDASEFRSWLRGVRK
jgi:glutaredoxin